MCITCTAYLEIVKNHQKMSATQGQVFRGTTKNVAKNSHNRDTFSVCHDQTDSKQNWHLLQTSLEHSKRRSISVVNVFLSV